MDIELVRQIVAVVTLRQPASVAHGVPVFYAEDEQEREEVAFLLGRLLDGVVHDLGNDSYVIIKY